MSRHSQSKSHEAELLQGTLDLLILKVLALEPLHGYGIAQRLQQISKNTLQIRQGSLYPALYRLEKCGISGRSNGSGSSVETFGLPSAACSALPDSRLLSSARWP